MVLTDQRIGPEGGGGGGEGPLAHCITKDEENPVLPLTLHGLAWRVRLPASTASSLALIASSLAFVIKFEKWGKKEPHTKQMCGREDKALTSPLIPDSTWSEGLKPLDYSKSD